MAAIVGTILSLATVVGLIVTIWQTNGALSEARRGNRLNLLFERRARRESRKAETDQVRALDIAERNAQAAVAQVEVSKDIAGKQLRAYVVIDDIHIEGDMADGILRSFTFSALLRNVGNTPAEVLDAYGDGWIIPVEEPRPGPNLTPKDGVFLAVSIGNISTPQKFASITYPRDLLVGVSTGRDHLYIYTVVRYRDIFGDIHEVVRCSEIFIRGTISPLILLKDPPYEPEKYSVTYTTVPNFGWST